MQRQRGRERDTGRERQRQRDTERQRHTETHREKQDALVGNANIGSVVSDALDGPMHLRLFGR